MKTLQYVLKTSKFKIANIRMIIFFTTFFILSWNFNQPYVAFIEEKGHPITWCIFPFYMTSAFILVFFYIGIIYINSDVPFMQHQNMYQVVRTGRSRWVIGQIAGIIIRAFAAVTVAAMATVIPFAGKLELTNRWGKVAKTLASQGGENNYGFAQGTFVRFRFFYGIMSKQTPACLMLRTILICGLLCSFIGLLMFLLSLYMNKMTAIAVALFAAIAPFIVENIHGRWKLLIAHFIPTYWAEIALSETPESGRLRLPPLPYIYSVLIICLICMIVLIYWKIRYVEFTWENEDV